MAGLIVRSFRSDVEDAPWWFYAFCPGCGACGLLRPDADTAFADASLSTHRHQDC